ncbi:hypothetical protein [Nocardia salmonicida]|uniref:hypothetical protein n=1 Tax=Nocardia salmonicida TaxID=53431 RepID=UPI003794B5C4
MPVVTAQLLQAAAAAGRAQQTRSFAAGMAGSTIGRLLSSAVEKLLDDHNWFGLFC